MLCVRCNKNIAEVYISGKNLCKFCSRDEIIKRIRREISSTRFLDREDSVLIIYPDFYKEIVKLTENIINRICKECKINFSVKEISDDTDINKLLWNISIEIKKSKENKIILPFTADFYLAYIIYSASKGKYYYINLYDITTNIFDKKIFVPFYSTPLMELKGFNEITGELNVKDELFNSILQWSKNNFNDNEIYHSFGNSISLIVENMKGRCKICNAILNSTDFDCCEYCSKSFSHLCLKQLQSKAEELH
ncbi:hypothetical protein DFR86_11835 [Acidianus sulfidivorans JP7]|uniref:hypothetical protein n=1 Tax=Acidianus sulfidivorans TaxID=312539 RepID=UPI0013A5B3F7|nr:hypothetical protein [Acidianus sulfidivorans]QIJ32893.1 hypothetical protein DFR86_11835 [Acidianus sulfidivorans JP7]